VVSAVGAADEVGHRGHGAVGDTLTGFFSADRAQVAGLAAEVLDDLGFGGKAEARLQPGSLPALTSLSS
jgi:hypothetical protein